MTRGHLSDTAISTTLTDVTGDGGRPPEVGLQGQASNRHKLRG